MKQSTNRISSDELSGLMRSAQEGDSLSYQKLLEEICVILRPRLAVKIFDSDDREDVLQEILIAVHLSKHTFLPEKSFLPWLSTIANYKIIDYIRKKERKKKREFILSNEYLPEKQKITLEDDSKERIDEILAHLSEKQRLIFRLLKLEKMSIAETAKILSMSRSAVKTAAHRIYKIIRLRPGGNL
ncbi:sigma-70 family RNA polymerase sigma factor [Leptospira sp. 2 VSF19]|uniref:Sigma-70 family RNA polymerase sigma factor n=1 Tax=Leptospira soteropolitanensis TaxID=2950025 RepID=A0AAW5VFR2_9LEPT|nr:sigma-70 family RNA polymerase sigma factor [Leptospira soteropolitanensis]MCW7491676.1 sigma-70 family RNA polymerase sigma factor [Leptospira soteropolitanensis]MCW7499260.1 sigma-70 family RNA polymerase sigma factor [Leptospira soteropolitanensis]MCW7521148.1 sigma-70 family RNA polymerase sigma factor [Leptospira soteropolitanensis]MCW7525364.1 sigma-70 family RNA polymerase sigma factor [Leptospira soteropolitanensis]MCW7529231.1 sigma-70 family RNA polymerase sigma factor [Leptospira